jgi:tetratricopeptide (TPR) repeat protein
MSYSDDRLSQASFMSPVDAEEFAKGLELRGLDRNNANPDFVIVHAHDKSVQPPCDWLILFEYEERLIATIVGSDSRTVIAPALDAAHDPASVQHYSAEEISQNFEFVRRDGVIDVYREKSTGKLVYHTRHTETDDEMFRQALDAVWMHRREPGTPPIQGDDQTVVRGVIEKLQSLAAKNPNSANVALGLGMAWFAIDNCERALQSLSRASELDSDNAVILKECAGVCLATNDFKTALELGRRAVSIKPDDVELLGNLAVIQLLGDQVSDAQQTIDRAVELDANDVVNKNVRAIIRDVVAGRRRRPATLEGMMKPAKPRSLLSKLLGRSD